MLRDREQIEDELQRIIGARTNPWGVTVQPVDMRDIVIPGPARGPGPVLTNLTNPLDDGIVVTWGS